MKPYFKLNLEYHNCEHLSQLYEGMLRLSRRNLVDLTLRSSENATRQKPIVRGELSWKEGKAFSIILDTLDGLNWIDGLSEEENLLYFHNQFSADYYFKRSVNAAVLASAPRSCKVLPLGLNTGFDVSEDVASPKPRWFNLTKSVNHLTRRPRPPECIKFTPENLGFPPIRQTEDRILLLTRLWDPYEIAEGLGREERIKINDLRISAIRSLRSVFRGICTAGLVDCPNSRRMAPDLILPGEITTRNSFIKHVRLHNICVATTGLHGSIGWRFAEYLLASRAVVTEPLQYAPAGQLGERENYLVFKQCEDLCSRVTELLDDKSLMEQMMRNNYEYSLLYINPEQHALQVLLDVHSTEENSS